MRMLARMRALIALETMHHLCSAGKCLVGMLKTEKKILRRKKSAQGNTLVCGYGLQKMS